MKKYILGFIFAFMAPVMFAYAATPTLTVTGADDNNNVTVRVTGGEVNAPVELFYNRPVGSLPERRTIGTTDINGSFTGTVSTSGFGITQVSPVYVQVGGYQSLPVNWPYSTGTTTTTGVITFSPTSPTFSVGQNGMVTISGGSGGTYYIASNSNPNFASASVSGNTLTLHGNQPGQANITVCSTSGPCAVITPNFSGTSGSATSTSGTTGSGAPILSQSSINVNQSGQGFVTLSGGSAPYTVVPLSGNSVSTTLIGNTLYVNGTAAGTATFNVCSTGTTTSASVCSPLTVNVQSQGQSGTGSGTGSTNPLSFTLPITSGEALRLSLSGGSGTYYVQTANNSPVNANVNGNVLTLVGSTLGTGVVNVCSSGTSGISTTCLPIAVTTSAAQSGTGGGFLFENNLSMGMSGQDVLELQNRLKEEGYFNVTSTGYFGPLTASAVRAYQAANGLPSVGVVGPQTRALLNQ